jgi:hypothetical protein
MHVRKQWVEFLKTKVYDGCVFNGSFELTNHSLEQRRWFEKKERKLIFVKAISVSKEVLN